MAFKTFEILSCTGADCTLAVEVIAECCCDDDCTLGCGDQTMETVAPKSADKSTEKHVPVIDKIDGGYKVTVGCVPHPMADDHYIQLIELRTADEVHRKYLKPGAAPEAVFKLADPDAEVCAVELCNKHGFWES